jgi:hypothetical protein
MRPFLVTFAMVTLIASASAQETLEYRFNSDSFLELTQEPDGRLNGHVFVPNASGLDVMRAYDVTGNAVGDAMALDFAPAGSTESVLSGTFVPYDPAAAVVVQPDTGIDLNTLRLDEEPLRIVPTEVNGFDPRLDVLIDQGALAAAMTDRRFGGSEFAGFDQKLMQVWTYDAALSDPVFADFLDSGLVSVVPSPPIPLPGPPDPFPGNDFAILPGAEDIVITALQARGAVFHPPTLPPATERHAILIATGGKVIPRVPDLGERQRTVRERLEASLSEVFQQLFQVIPFQGTEYQVWLVGFGRDFRLQGRAADRFYRLSVRIVAEASLNAALGFDDVIRIIFEDGEYSRNINARTAEEAMRGEFNDIESDAEDRRVVPAGMVTSIAVQLMETFDALKG